MQTLKHIHIVMYVMDSRDDPSPLFGIPSGFEDMRTKNSIETVTIEVHMDARIQSHGGDDWCRLDEVFTSPGWFSLKQISLVIIIRFIFLNNELEEVLRKSLRTQFPRLSSSNSVLFNFEFISK